MISTIKIKIEQAGLSYSKTLLILGIVNIALLGGGVTLFIILKSILLFAFCLLGMFLFDASFYYFINNRISQNEYDLESDFISLLSYFEIFIANNINVYTSFLYLKEYACPRLKENIEKMLESVDEDKSIRPFVDFALIFKPKIFQTLMTSIYQMIDEGEDGKHLQEFTYMFDNLTKERNANFVYQKCRSFENMNMFPLIGAGLITLILTYCILIVIGGMIK